MNSKLLLGIVVVSVALNLLLAGFILGNKSRPFPSFDPTRGFAPWVRNLPAERQAELQPITREAWRGAAPVRLRKLHRDFRSALAADPLDEAALATALSKIRAGHEQRQIASHQAFINLAAALSLPERQALVAELERRPKRRSARRGAP